MTSRHLRTAALSAVAATTVLAAVGFAVPAGAAQPSPTPAGVSVPAGWTARVVASSASKAMTGLDDITTLDGKLFVGFQNGVGTMGEPAPSGATASTLVEYSPDGRTVAQWNLTGKIDGLGANPRTNEVIATVNEDGNSSIYTVEPRAHGARVHHYAYNLNPLPHGGGTDSITVHHGVVYLAASNPGTNAAGQTGDRPAMYTVCFAGSTAALSPVFPDDVTATNLVTGATGALNLTDPDSSNWVPAGIHGIGNTLMLDSQGDQELVFVKHPGEHNQSVSVLPLSTSVDDTVFATSTRGTLYVVDSGGTRLIAITGPFRKGEVFTSASGLSTLDPSNGQATGFGSGIQPKGLLFVAADGNRTN
ncbi:MAG TPA: hypothetical protein VG247_00115 [Pseudonocardiaceae bacterium]|jgi:hypothetical protein|nr:hypothetical protein [Pseudonocardiaceae bacterium]